MPVPYQPGIVEFTFMQLKELGRHPTTRMRPDGYGDPHETNRNQRND